MLSVLLPSRCCEVGYIWFNAVGNFFTLHFWAPFLYTVKLLLVVEMMASSFLFFFTNAVYILTIVYLRI